MKSAGELPSGPLIAWYGDDFTGSAAVMEVLALAGIPAVLFLDIPTPERLSKFEGYRGLGIAGVARSKSPRWMTENLPTIFNALASFRAPLTQYKICSTLDSAPRMGSIGMAVELADREFQSNWIPLLTAAPAIHRYQLFGNLFACAEGECFRLDRHPTMSRHPVTPMKEADVRVHLAEQTRMPIGLIDYLSLTRGHAETRLRSETAAGRRLIAVDVIDETSLIEAGRLIWTHRDEGFFAVGSQGIEYALVAFWRACGLIKAESKSFRAPAVDRIAVVSGSCSPATHRQITWAAEHGFEPIRLDPRCALDECAWSDAIANAVHDALGATASGRDPIVFTASGPEDPAISAFFESLKNSGANHEVVNERIGTGLGRILESIFRQTDIRRGIFAGGDTSSYGAKALGVHALTLLADTVPGGGLCRAHSDDPLYAHLEIALKGGQMGPPDYFSQIKAGGPTVSR